MSYDWLDDNEYPSNKDIEDLGEDSPYDYDPFYAENENRPSLSTRYVVILVMVIIMIGALILPFIL